MNHLTLLKDLVFPITSLVISLIALYFSLKNENKEKFSISIDFFSEKHTEWLVDRKSTTEPDVYYQNKFRYFPIVVITNNSSLPITINRFKINNTIEFSPFARIGSDYKVTYEGGNFVEFNTKFYSVGPTRTMNLDSIKGFIDLPVTIKPYESITGLLFFDYNDSIVGDNILSVETSRGSKNFPLIVTSQLISTVNPD